MWLLQSPKCFYYVAMLLLGFCNVVVAESWGFLLCCYAVAMVLLCSCEGVMSVLTSCYAVAKAFNVKYYF